MHTGEDINLCPTGNIATISGESPPRNLGTVPTALSQIGLEKPRNNKQKRHYSFILAYLTAPSVTWIMQCRVMDNQWILCWKDFPRKRSFGRGGGGGGGGGGGATRAWGGGGR